MTYKGDDGNETTTPSAVAVTDGNKVVFTIDNLTANEDHTIAVSKMEQ